MSDPVWIRTQVKLVGDIAILLQGLDSKKRKAILAAVEILLEAETKETVTVP